MHSDGKVFVVDDDDAVRASMSLALRARGYAVEPFASAQEFLSAYCGHRPACIVLDLSMPGMTGAQLQEELIARREPLPILFLSGYVDVPTAVKCIQRGAVDVIEKPCSPSELAEKIDFALHLDEKALRETVEASDVVRRFKTLTNREHEVMALLVAAAKNTSNRQIATQLGISHRTVDGHRARVMKKMRARSRAELVAMAKTCGLETSV